MTTDAQLPSLRVLLVEDNEHDRVAFERALARSEFSFEVTFCERAEEIPAAMQAGSGAFDIVVVDYNLPGKNGLEAYTSLRAETELPPFVMLTGAGSEYLAVNALKAGMFDYIIKDPNQGYLWLLPLKLMDVKQRHNDRLSRLEAKAQLKKAKASLEHMVERRTAELARTVRILQEEVAERREAEQALRRSRQALRVLSIKIVETQENERRQLAKELHDSIGSSLAAIKFGIEEKLQDMGEPPAGCIALESIVAHIQQTIQEVRRISTSLRPSMLDDMGLLATLEWFCRTSGDIFKKIRIEHHFGLKEGDIPAVAKIVLYRVAQESVNNALKHSMAESVRVSLEKKDGCVVLCVADNGEGFDPQAARDSDDPMTGYGLKGMYDRAEVVGGTLCIDSQPGRGTTVCLELPCGLDLEGTGDARSPSATRAPKSERAQFE